jgi:hypothetical protein
VSRFKTRAGCFLYGKLRQTDFLPVGDEKEGEVLERGVESETSDEDEKGMEHAFQGGGSDVFDVSDNWGHADLQVMNDDFGTTTGLAEMAPLYDGEECKPEPALDDDFNDVLDVSDNCGHADLQGRWRAARRDRQESWVEQSVSSCEYLTMQRIRT